MQATLTLLWKKAETLVHPRDYLQAIRLPQIGIRLHSRSKPRIPREFRMDAGRAPAPMVRFREGQSGVPLLDHTSDDFTLPPNL